LVRVVTSTREPSRDPGVDLLDEVVDLALGRLHDDLGVGTRAGGAHDLLDHLAGLAQLERARGGRQEHDLADALHDLLEAQRPVVGGRRQPEPELDQVLLAAAVAPRTGRAAGGRTGATSSRTTRKSSGKKSSRVLGASPAARPSIGGGVVLDAVAEADLLHHLEVVLGAHAQALGLEQLALRLEPGQPLLQLGLDAGDGGGASARAGHVVGGGNTTSSSSD
jgi:hypothetical protein